MLSEKQKMLSGLPYRPGDSELQKDMQANRAWLDRYNRALSLSPSDRHALLTDHLKAVAQTPSSGLRSIVTAGTTSPWVPAPS